LGSKSGAKVRINGHKLMYSPHLVPNRLQIPENSLKTAYGKPFGSKNHDLTLKMGVFGVWGEK